MKQSIVAFQTQRHTWLEGLDWTADSLIEKK